MNCWFCGNARFHIKRKNKNKRKIQLKLCSTHQHYLIKPDNDLPPDEEDNTGTFWDMIYCCFKR